MPQRLALRVTNNKSTYKKVVVRRLDRSTIKGFVDSTAYLQPGCVEMLDRQGRAVRVLLEDIKGIFFVREFEGNPQRSERKLFQSRPRLAGLWVHMTFKDNEVLEGLLPSNLAEFDPQGFLLTPADLYSNNLKIFVPRTALSRIDVLGVIPDARTRGLAQRTRRLAGATAERQMGLFPNAEEPAKKLP